MYVIFVILEQFEIFVIFREGWNCQGLAALNL